MRSSIRLGFGMVPIEMGSMYGPPLSLFTLPKSLLCPPLSVDLLAQRPFFFDSPLSTPTTGDLFGFFLTFLLSAFADPF